MCGLIPDLHQPHITTEAFVGQEPTQESNSKTPKAIAFS